MCYVIQPFGQFLFAKQIMIFNILYYNFCFQQAVQLLCFIWKLQHIINERSNMDWNAYMKEIGHEIATLSKEVPETANGFAQMGAAAKFSGALDEKTKEIMALGIAVATRCESCIGFHIKSLVGLGLTRDELCEALAMATFMGGGPSYAYSAKALSAYDTFSKVSSS